MGLRNYSKVRVLNPQCNTNLEYWIDNEFRVLDSHCNQNLEYWIDNVSNQNLEYWINNVVKI